MLAAQTDNLSASDSDRFMTPVADIVDRREVTERRPLALLLEADRIDREIFGFVGYLWSY